MEKSVVDAVITEYVPKIYGFALSKTGDSRKAEELASDITYEVYFSLLRAAEVYNVNSYIWRIASYVYAHYVDRRRRERERGGASVEEIEADIHEDGGYLPESLIDRNDPAALYRADESRAEHEDDLCRMRREIAYLGETQRKIIVAHYLRGQSVAAIATELGIPVGTVKWHLHDARNTIKEGMNMERTKGKLGYDPIRLVGLAHGGSPGSTGDTSDHLNSRLSQNIAYAAYDEPKTEAEIAEELGVSPLYLAEFIKDLEEYGFMTRLPNGRLRTDVVIARRTKEALEALHQWKKEVTQTIGERYADTFVANMDAYLDAHRADMYVPDNDRDLWRWSAFAWGQNHHIDREFASMDAETEARINRFRYQRPDGGHYTAYATLDTPLDLTFDPDKYLGGLMVRGCDNTHDGTMVMSIQYPTVYDTRPAGWQDNRHEDYVALYECYTGHLPETPVHVEKYRRLFDRGLIVRRNGEISVNVPVLLNTLPDFDLFAGVDIAEYHTIMRAFGERCADIEAPLYPKHMQDCIRAHCMAATYCEPMYLCEWLLENGYLTLPEDDRRGGLMTVVTAAKLPR